MPEDMKKEFEEWHQHLFWLEKVRVPRWAFRQDEKNNGLSFYVFVDASQDTYAAALFVRVENSKSVNLSRVAKSRVAPMERFHDWNYLLQFWSAFVAYNEKRFKFWRNRNLLLVGFYHSFGMDSQR